LEIAQVNPSVRFKALKIDLALSYREDFGQILEQELGDLDISVLVNNVGIGKFVPFHTASFKYIKNTVIVNVMPQVFITHYVIKKMLVRQTVRPELRSAIINMSSIVSVKPRRNFYDLCSDENVQFGVE